MHLCDFHNGNYSELVRELEGVARMGLAWRVQGARRRRCGAIVDDEQHSNRLDCCAGPDPLGFRLLLILGQAPSSGSYHWDVLGLNILVYFLDFFPLPDIYLVYFGKGTAQV
jgi:hypothetical protein